MADVLRLYVLCPSCGGTGKLPWGFNLEPGDITCPKCQDDPENELGPQEIDGLRHIYYGRFIEDVD